MLKVEHDYFKSVRLPRSPYNDPSGRTCQPPDYPPKPTSMNVIPETDEIRPDSYIETAKKINRRRRGLEEDEPDPPENLSPAQTLSRAQPFQETI